jgi:hypothetical protein
MPGKGGGGAEAVPDFTAEPPAREGYLWKRSDHVKKWHKRWFVLWPAEVRPGHGRVLFWFASPRDTKPKGTAKLVPGAFNILTQQTSQQSKKERKFALTCLIELPDRDAVRLAADNDRELLGWVDAIHARDREGGAPRRGGAGGKSLSFQPVLSAQPQRGFTQHAAAGGAAAVERVATANEAAGMDTEASLVAALQLLLPGCDVLNARPRDLLGQAQHAAAAREGLQHQAQQAAAAERKVEQLQARLCEAGDAAEQAQTAETERLRLAEQDGAELRGENRLLIANVNTLQKTLSELQGHMMRVEGDSATAGEGLPEGIPGTVGSVTEGEGAESLEQQLLAVEELAAALEVRCPRCVLVLTGIALGTQRLFRSRV